MKKLLVLIAGLLLFTTSPLRSQTYEEGDIIIEGYYGWPNLWSSLFKTAIQNNAVYDQNFTQSTIGPLGGRVEYLFSENIGLGVNINHANSKISTRVLEYDPNTGIERYYNYSLEVPRFRVMATFNYHFGEDERLDPYFSTGLGFKSQDFIIKTDSPSEPDQLQIGGYIPIAWRIAEFGLRVYFTDNIGGHIAAGLGGGPLLQGGLTIKL